MKENKSYQEKPEKLKGRGSNKNKLPQKTSTQEAAKLQVEKVKTSRDVTEGRLALIPLSNNIVHWSFLYSLGSTIPSNLSMSLNSPIINYMKSLKVNKSYNGFSRRVTALAWHPTESNIVAVGSKGGDIILWNYEKEVEPELFVEGIGPGGSIQALLFDERVNGQSIFHVSVSGLLSLKHLKYGALQRDCEYLATDSVDHWFTSLDISFPDRTMLVGDNKGSVNLLSIGGERQWKKRLHKQKVTHIEFSPKETCYFVTSSVDRELKLWDIRKIKDKHSSLFTRSHDKPINSAHFSRTNGGSIVTTDQYDRLHIYSCPNLSLSHSIYHPHRQFQHLTPIKATWHPLKDIAVVGRYPHKDLDPDDFRSVDFFDGSMGQLLHQHVDRQTCDKIVSLNLFNALGDVLLSGAACGVMIWKPNFDSKESRERARLHPEDRKEENEDTENGDKGKKERKNTKRKYVELDLSKLKQLKKKG